MNTEDQGHDPNASGGGHPAWQEVLGVIPESLHTIVTPALEKWDKNVEGKVQSIKEQYQPYQQFIDNSVDAQQMQQALFILNELQNNPEQVVADVIQHFGLNFAAVSDDDDDDDDNYDPYDSSVDITKHPQFKELAKSLEAIQGRLSQQEEQEKRSAEQQAFDKQLEDLTTQHGAFDRLYVTALMSNGFTADQAIKQYFDTVNSAAQALMQNNGQQPPSNNNPPPVVMGGDGNTGSGLPTQPVSFAGMKNTEVNDLVIQMLKQATSQ